MPAQTPHHVADFHGQQCSVEFESRDLEAPVDKALAKLEQAGNLGSKHSAGCHAGLCGRPSPIINTKALPMFPTVLNGAAEDILILRFTLVVSL